MDPGKSVRVTPSFGYRTTRWLAKSAVEIFYGFSVEGAERLPPSGGAVVAYNHQSFLDPIVAAIATERELTWIARTTLNDSPLYRFLTRPVPVVSIHRGQADKAALEVVVERARRGALIAMFPEETRSVDGRLGTLKAGFFLIAKFAQVPIVPAHIAGTFAIWPRQRRLPRLRGEIRVRYGEPFSVADVDRRDAVALLAQKLEALGVQPCVATAQSQGANESASER